MFQLNDDMSIYLTRGDTVYLSVSANNGGEEYIFKAGEVVRFKVFGKKDAENVVLQKDFPVTADTSTVDIILTKEDTKIGEVISKPKDYWYEIELNPFDDPRTIIGYDEDGAKILKLFPEGDDVPEYVPDPEVIKVMDTELDMTSDRPVQNQAVARAFASLKADYNKTKDAVVSKSDATASALVVERGRIDNLISHKDTTLNQALGYLEGISEATRNKIDGSISSDGVFAILTINLREANLIYSGAGLNIFSIPDVCRPIETGVIHTQYGLEFIINYNGGYYLTLKATGTVAPTEAATVTITYALGDYELKDIRVGADGEIYGTAGDAVREQIIGTEKNILSDFVKSGGSDAYISNVEIYTDEYDYLLISDIRNGYNGSVGFAIFKCDSSGNSFETIKAVHTLNPVQKRVQISFGANSLLICDFNVDGMGSETRYTDVGKKSMIKPSRIMSRALLDRIEKAQSDTELITTNASISLFEKMGVVGDSFASGEIYVQQTDGTYKSKDYYNLSWGQIIAREYGISCKNYSAGGLSTRTWLTSNKGLALLRSDEPQQLYILALGINDAYKLGLEYLGTIDDITDNYNENPDSFYGNYARIIEQIKAHAPNSRIIISTMAETRWDCTAYNEAIEAIAEHYNIPCIKQYEDKFFNSDFYMNYQVQGHPISVVYSGMAKAIVRLVEKAMAKDYWYFISYVG